MQSANIHFKEIMDKLFSYSPFEYTPEFLSTPNWIELYQWKDDEEEEFKEYLFQKLKKSHGARKFFMRKPSGSVAACEHIMDLFMTFYGWKTIDTKQIAE